MFVLVVLGDNRTFFKYAPGSSESVGVPVFNSVLEGGSSSHEAILERGDSSVGTQALYDNLQISWVQKAS